MSTRTTRRGSWTSASRARTSHATITERGETDPTGAARRAAAAGGTALGPDVRRRDHRHRRVHGAGAGAGQARRPARGHLCAGTDPLRHARRPGPGGAIRQRDQRAHRAHARGAAADQHHQPGSAGSARSGDRPLPRARSGLPATRRRGSSRRRCNGSTTRASCCRCCAGSPAASSRPRRS